MPKLKAVIKKRQRGDFGFHVLAEKASKILKMDDGHAKPIKIGKDAAVILETYIKQWKMP